jgi:Fe-S cluster assembly iron-binding protein IscA
MMNVSDTAATRINELLAEENETGLRVFVQGGGCGSSFSV